MFGSGVIVIVDSLGSLWKCECMVLGSVSVGCDKAICSADDDGRDDEAICSCISPPLKLV